MTNDNLYHAAIIGGGLAGLSVSIQLARKGYNVLLFEKETYPFHRVCGEYISMESWDYLISLGIDLEHLKVPKISKLQVTSVSGKVYADRLDLGGFGISRYLLDGELARLATEAGVEILQNTKVSDISFANGGFLLRTSAGNYKARVACGSFGKRSNLDIHWNRAFTKEDKSKLNNFIAVKYHVRSEGPKDLISLHVFDKGYCGFSRVEEGVYNLCYLTTAKNLQDAGGSILKLEENILSKNPNLEKILSGVMKIDEKPLTISQISFSKKEQVEEHVLMLGDAAGLITPLCGNGMSMALHAGKIASDIAGQFLDGTITREEMEQQYEKLWNKEFSKRLLIGRFIQKCLYNRRLTNSLIWIGTKFPALMRALIRQTHGRRF